MFEQLQYLAAKAKVLSLTILDSNIKILKQKDLQ